MTTAATGLAARKFGKWPLAEHASSGEDDVWDESKVDQGEEGSTADERLHGSGSPTTSHASSNFSSSILAKSPEDALAAMFDQRVQLLSSTLEGLKGKCEVLQEQLAESSAVCTSYASRWGLARRPGLQRRGSRVTLVGAWRMGEWLRSGPVRNGRGNVPKLLRRLARSEDGARRLRVESELGRERERQLQQEVRGRASVCVRVCVCVKEHKEACLFVSV